MALQTAECAVVGHRALYGILKCAGFLASKGQNYYFLGRKYGGNAYGEGLAGYFVKVAVKETGVNLAGVLGKGNYAGA